MLNMLTSWYEQMYDLWFYVGSRTAM